MNWFINQIFGSHASSNLGDKIKALVAQYAIVNPSFTQASVETWVQSQADHLIAQVLVFFPGWASSILTEFLNSEIGKLTAQAYAAVVPGTAGAAQS